MAFFNKVSTKGFSDLHILFCLISLLCLEEKIQKCACVIIQNILANICHGDTRVLRSREDNFVYTKKEPFPSPNTRVWHVLDDQTRGKDENVYNNPLIPGMATLFVVPAR
jgi:hypothetical protein